MRLPLRSGGRHRFAVLTLAFALAAAVPAGPAAQASQCTSFRQGNLQEAVFTNVCLELQPGTYLLRSPLRIPPGHTLEGIPGEATRTILLASRASRWPATEGMVAPLIPRTGLNKPPAILLEHVTVDGNSGFNPATSTWARDGAGIGVTTDDMMLVDVTVTEARCDGLSVYSDNLLGTFSTVIVQSTVIRNGADCLPSSIPPGAGIYVVRPRHSQIGRLLISDDRIVDNDGPAIDIDGVSGGVVTGSVLSNLASYVSDSGRTWPYVGWAALSIVNASGWTVSGDVITEPMEPMARRGCATPGAPTGFRTAATAGILICAKQAPAESNVIGPNPLVEGRFGILVSGLRGHPATGNALQNNVVLSSHVACADHFGPGHNRWVGNVCHGAGDVAGLNPEYF